SCCSHLRAGETYEEAAHRRWVEEVGFECEIEEKFQFIYKAKLGERLYDGGLDRVCVGYYDVPVEFNKDEVKAVKWIDMDELIQDIENRPEKYTAWFKIIFEKYLSKLNYAGNHQ